MPYPRPQKQNQDGGQYTQQTRDEYTIPRTIADLHTKIPYYLAAALIYGNYNDEESIQTANSRRLKAVEYFLALIGMTYPLKEVKNKLANNNCPQLPKTRAELVDKLSHYANKVTSQELDIMYDAYAEILNESGLLSAYDMRPTNKTKFYQA